MRPLQWALVVVVALLMAGWTLVEREAGRPLSTPRDWTRGVGHTRQPSALRAPVPKRPPLNTCTLWAEPSFYVCSNGTGWNRQDGGWAFAGYQSGGPIVPQR